MATKYTGSLTLEWFNKQKAILLQDEGTIKGENDIPAPRLNWVNRDDALFYAIIDEEGKGKEPYWVDRNDIRVKEARPLVFQKAYIAQEENKQGALLEKEFKVIDSNVDDPNTGNILIKGDNLLALNTLKKLFENRLDEEKVKCI